MTLGVVSDTHMPRMAKALPRALVAGLQKHRIDVLVHCGDIVSENVLPLFENIAPLQAVAGNNDPDSIVQRFGRKRILHFGSIRIGVVHGDGAKTGLKTPEHAYRQFEGEGVLAVLFGHSHIPYHGMRSGVILFNPGSPTDKRMNPRYSYGIVRIEGASIDARHYYYWNKSP